MKQEMTEERRLLLRWRQMVRVVGVSEDWAEFDNFFSWFTEHSVGMDWPVLRRIDMHDKFSAENCTVVEKRTKAMIKRTIVEKRIYKKEYADGSVLFTAYADAGKGCGVTIGTYQSIEAARAARKRMYAKPKIVSAKDEGSIVILFEGDQFARPYVAYIDGYPVGWYLSESAAREEAKRLMNHAEYQNARLRAIGENDITDIDVNELVGELKKEREEKHI